MVPVVCASYLYRCLQVGSWLPTAGHAVANWSTVDRRQLLRPVGPVHVHPDTCPPAADLQVTYGYLVVTTANWLL